MELKTILRERITSGNHESMSPSFFRFFASHHLNTKNVLFKLVVNSQPVTPNVYVSIHRPASWKLSCLSLSAGAAALHCLSRPSRVSHLKAPDPRPLRDVTTSGLKPTYGILVACQPRTFVNSFVVALSETSQGNPKDCYRYFHGDLWTSQVLTPRPHVVWRHRPLAPAVRTPLHDL